MRIVVKRSISLSLIRCIFELKMICLEGEAPQVFSCVGCGKQGEPYWFSAAKGGLLCGIVCRKRPMPGEWGSPQSMRLLLLWPLR